ncbi:MAG: hypothetical protein WAV05_11440 [Anaerolineales bacterium]
MTSESVFYYLATWSVIGFIAFSAYVFVVFRTGLAYTARKQDGTMKEHIPLSGYINMFVLHITIIAFQYLANYLGLARENVAISFLSLFLLNFSHYFFLFVFDSVVIDGLVLSVWRPKFLHLPSALGSGSMKKHILISIPVGIAAGIILTTASTTISYFTLFRA